MKKEEIYKDNLSELKEMISRAEYLKYTLGSLIYWDKITYMPPKGDRIQDQGYGFSG